ncbi:hypothetical protein F6J84_05945 [Microbacterium caowuchunii]|uniref:hypothetical protein n=1 Tax=Microbacterium caowuchunii TaxID=2614638 RepID=UPI00124571D0|nr:hypothetical protein [Microbacterium caowuchunii]QEV99685.1 hypothetical protein F6J84_05945 [Microbacterium caowuchunii]
MYQLPATSTGVLATTGVALAAQNWVAAWTLFVAGLAALSISRIVGTRKADRVAARVNDDDSE